MTPTFPYIQTHLKTQLTLRQIVTMHLGGLAVFQIRLIPVSLPRFHAPRWQRS